MYRCEYNWEVILFIFYFFEVLFRWANNKWKYLELELFSEQESKDELEVSRNNLKERMVFWLKQIKPKIFSIFQKKITPPNRKEAGQKIVIENS